MKTEKKFTKFVNALEQALYVLHELILAIFPFALIAAVIYSCVKEGTDYNPWIGWTLNILGWGGLVFAMLQD